MVPQNQRPAGPGTGMGQGNDGLFLAAVGLVAVVAGGTLGVVEVAGLFAGHPGPHLTGAGLAHGFVRWHEHAGNPRLAFDEPTRSELPGPAGMYGAVAVMVLVLAALGVLAGTLYARRGHRPKVDAAARRRQGLVPDREIAKAYPAHPGSIELARTDQTGRAVHLGSDRSMGALMGPGAGKSAAAVGWILDAPGSVLVTSTKTELWTTTARLRQDRTGQIASLFDPANVGGQGSLGWSPIEGCENQDTAIRRANALMDGVQLSGTSGNAGFFRSAGSIVIRLALHGCALSGRGVDQLRSWVQNPDDEELVETLGRSDAAPGWRDDLLRQARASGETVTNIGLTVATALECFANAAVRETCSPTPGQGFRLADWAAGSGGSLYVVAPRTIRNLTALSSVFVAEAFHEARQAAYRSPGQRLDPPVRFILDELPSLCAIDEIDTYVAEGRGPGLPVMWIAQSREQLVERLGQAKANALMDASEVMLYGGGMDSPQLYETMSARIGDVGMARTTSQRDPYGNMSTGTQTEYRPIMSPADLYRLGTVQDRQGGHRWGLAMMMGRQGSTVVRLMPWWSRKDADQIRAASGLERRPVGETTATLAASDTVPAGPGAGS